jgi:hypothetical protein
MNDNREAALALLMLSTGFFRTAPTPHIYHDSDDDDELMEPNSDYNAFRPHLGSRQPFTNKRQLSPLQCEGKRQRRWPPEMEGCHMTPKTSINRLLPAANFFRPINPVHQHFDENLEHNYAALSRKSAGFSPQGTASPVTSEASLMDEVCVTIPVVQQWSVRDLMEGLSAEVRAELEKMQRRSKFAKEAYTREQIEASPIEFGKFARLKVSLLLIVRSFFQTIIRTSRIATTPTRTKLMRVPKTTWPAGDRATKRN